MSDNEAYINKFLSGALSPEEEAEFKSRLKSDDELYAEFLLETEMKDHIRARTLLEEIENDPDLPRVQAEVDVYMEDLRKEKGSGKSGSTTKHAALPKRRPSRILRWSIPAAAIVCVLLILRFYTTVDPIIRMYNKYYNPLPEDAFEQEYIRGESDELILEGISCYLEGDYQCVIQKLKPGTEGSFLLGISYMGLDQYEEALESLENFLTEHPDHPEALWYLGLTSIRLGNTSKAQNYLTHLIRVPSVHRQEAERLLEKISDLSE